MKKEQWINLMNRFGFSENVQEFEMILKSYNESHRKYHNAQHITDCLAKCELNEETKNNPALHLAIWYHDLIYKPLQKNNELKSAERAEKFLKNQFANDELIKNVKRLIMVTLHNQTPTTEAEGYMMDIDISILGSDNNTYTAYTQNIRKEYKWVPYFLYKKKRIEILEMFRNKETLYFTDYFKTRLEQQARVNIENEINQLKMKS